MSASYTPGPWAWSADFTNSNDEPTQSLIGEGGYGILSCDQPNAPQSLGSVGMANTRLIAAAPDLLAALTSLRDTLKRNGYATDLADAALARATGEQQ